jgi:transcriptional regulator with XRE-family HTH domain
MRGRDLRRIRTKLGLSQQAFAKQLGLTANHVSRLERGVVAITQTVARFVRLLEKQGGRQ